MSVLFCSVPFIHELPTFEQDSHSHGTIGFTQVHTRCRRHHVGRRGFPYVGDGDWIDALVRVSESSFFLPLKQLPFTALAT